MTLTRRGLIAGGLAGGAGLLAGCDRLGQDPLAKGVLFSGERFQRALHRLIVAPDALAPEYRLDQRSPDFRVNGTANPNTPSYNQAAAERFANWRVGVTGLVQRPLSLSLADLAAFPARTQVTRHDCVEGWSAVGQWAGPRLSHVLKAAGLRDGARFVVFRCADLYGTTPYYESLDLVDAFHPQTILALAMNGRALTVGHGAPVRLRVERQLGYKHAKYVTGVEAVADLSGVGLGKGGFWEDRADYDWYAGI